MNGTVGNAARLISVALTLAALVFYAGQASRQLTVISDQVSELSKQVRDWATVTMENNNRLSSVQEKLKENGDRITSIQSEVTVIHERQIGVLERLPHLERDFGRGK